MKAIDFKERTDMIAETQPQYEPLPAFINRHPQGKGEVIFCMRLTLVERLRLLFTGKLWVCLLCFGRVANAEFYKENKVYGGIPPSYITTKKKEVLV